MRFLKKIFAKIRGEQSLNKLILKGLSVGRNFQQMGGCIIDPSHCWHIEIGDDVILAPRVHILAHDASTKLFLGYTKIANVKIGNRVFVGAGSIILPGVTIGDDVIIGAGSIISKDVASNSVVAGAPSRFISDLETYIIKRKKEMNLENCFSSEYSLRNKNITEQHKLDIKTACIKFGVAFLE